MAEEALKFGFRLFFGIIFGLLIMGFLGFLIPAAYFTAQTGSFSLLWIGSFIFLGIAIILTITLWIIATR